MNFSELFEVSASQLDKKINTIVDAHVLRIERDQVILDVGLKSEGVVPLGQFLNDEGEVEIQEGDSVHVVVEHIDSGVGLTSVSREQAKRLEAMDLIEKAHEGGEILKGKVVAKIRGGYQVEVNHLRAFLPGSLVGGMRGSRESMIHEGQIIEFKVNSVDKEKSNVIVSRRAVMEATQAVDQEELQKRIYEGAVVKGIVKNMTDYGAFVDLNGIDGLLHNFDISWRRVRHPSEVLAVDQEIEVKVLRFDKESNRVSLGVKQLQEDPWESLASNFPENSITKAVVTNITNYGFFAEVAPGVEGLVHVSEIDWSNKNIHPSRVVEVGQEIDVMVLNINQENRRMSLGMKQTKPNPWESFSETHKPNDVIKGTIHSVTDFGLFVGLSEGIDGLVHNSDIAWEAMDVAKITSLYKKDDEIEVVITSVDPQRERVSLSIKHLTPNPSANFFEKNPVGTKVSSVIKSLEGPFAILSLEEEALGQIKKSELPDGQKEGDKLSFFVSSFDEKRNLVTLTKELDSFKQDEYENPSNNYPDIEARSTKLGDLLKQEMDESKE